ncbi:MAG TPA: transglutaminase domain-containing protein [Patescibacteria group bacterium]|nr:transglutaminase domain-containing protein [Patescibacteria group bacterium]
MTVECQIEFKNIVYDQILVPIPRDRITSKTYRKGIFIIPPYNNKVSSVELNPGQEYKLNFIAPNLPTEPPKTKGFLAQCLSNDERYTKWKMKNLGREIIPYQAADKKIVEKIGMFVKTKLNYSRDRDSYVYIDDLLLSDPERHPLQDCLGYHSCLVGCLRSMRIPAVLDIGFRLTSQDNPHTWAWYFDRQENNWVWVDLNDRKDEVAFGPKGLGRVSMTFGTTHVIKDVPNFPDSTVSFIQYGLGKRRIENTPPFTQANFKVVVNKQV